jgi:protein-S-isoprenylcysteine O-methyltransferase Ste14
MKNLLTYPHLLVTAQFGLIGLMILFSRGVLHSPVAITVFLIGVFIGFWAIAHNQLGNFHIRPVLKEGCQLTTTGPYRLIRHPMYTSVITMMLGVLISTPTLLEAVMFVVLVAVLYLKAHREEELWCGHNEIYLAYQKKTKLFIPYIL